MLEVRISKKFETFELDVDFSTKEGITALLGASGSGKSMTLKCIAGIERPDEGRIVLNGKVLFDSEKRINLVPQKRNVGYMFQDYALFPSMTVMENIMIAMRKVKKNRRRQEAAKFIEKFRLEGLENHYPMQLSGGQKQRVAMARMLASEPELILLDEPFSALDSYLRWELEEEMREILASLGQMVLFVSHDRDEVYRLCDQVSCLSEGRMEKPVEKKEFFNNPGTKTAAALSGCKNISAVEKIDDHRLRVLDWNQELVFEHKIREKIRYIGIRAHSLIPVYEGAEIDQKNVFAVKEYRFLEEPFEWSFSFRNGSDSRWIQWKVAKSDWDSSRIPVGFLSREEDILLLAE